MTYSVPQNYGQPDQVFAPASELSPRRSPASSSAKRKDYDSQLKERQAKMAQKFNDDNQRSQSPGRSSGYGKK